MPCNCGKGTPKVAMTSAEATARYMQETAAPKYKAINPDGTENIFELYVDAKTHAVRSGGVVTEVREPISS